MSHYDSLGVPKDASPEEIKRAYKRKAQRAHPDKPGGSEERFLAVKKGYEVLSSPTRRAQYDKTGNDGPEETIDATRSLAMQEVASLILGAIEALNVDRQDIIKLCRGKVTQFEAKRVGDIALIRRRIKRMESALKRLVRKHKKGSDFIRKCLERSIENERENIAEGERMKLKLDLMTELLDEYEYQVETEVTTTTSLLGDLGRLLGDAGQ